ncbi:hypothetical protein D3C79_946650 [compost metagenome]
MLASEFPAKSLTLDVTVAIYSVAAVRSTVGSNVTTVLAALIVNEPVTSVPSALETKKFEPVTVEDLIASSNVQITLVLTTTPVAASVMLAVTVGAVVSLVSLGK